MSAMGELIHDAAVVVHVTGGSVAIIAGYAALAFRKGERLHRAAGTAFFISMLIMAAFATGLAAVNGERLNLVAGAFTMYLVSTAWGTVRRPEGVIGRAETGAFVLAAGVALLGVLVG